MPGLNPSLKKEEIALNASLSPELGLKIRLLLARGAFLIYWEVERQIGIKKTDCNKKSRERKK